MEHYYFLEKNGTKLGPYKINDLSQQTIYFDDLVWRSDSEQWKKAIDFEELSGIYIIKPPLTAKEQKKKEVNGNLIGQIFRQLAIFYFISSLFIGFISFGIAQASWEKYLKETDGKYLGNNNSYNSSRNFSGFITLKELNDNKRYPSYVPNYNNESAYGYGQSFLFRSFRAFGSTIYLTKEEQEDSGKLFFNLLLSSFVSLSFIFIIIGIIHYGIKRIEREDDN